MGPDLVWYLESAPAAVIDAKYKAEKPDGFPDADLYKLLADATALGLDHGHLVYAKGNEVAQSWNVRNAGITIVANTLDLAAARAAILEQVASLAVRIADTAAAPVLADGRRERPVPMRNGSAVTWRPDHDRPI